MTVTSLSNSPAANSHSKIPSTQKEERTKIVTAMIRVLKLEDMRLQSHLLYGICTKIYIEFNEHDRARSLAGKILLKSIRNLFLKTFPTADIGLNQLSKMF